MGLIDSLFSVFVVCVAIQVILDIYLMTQLKNMHPEEYSKAGKPWWFWNDYRTFIYIGYILKGEYKNIQDKNLVYVFGISRVIIYAILAYIFVFIVSIFLIII